MCSGYKSLARYGSGRQYANDFAAKVVEGFRAKVQGFPVQHLTTGTQVHLGFPVAHMGAVLFLHHFHCRGLCGHQPGTECVQQMAEHASYNRL